MNSRALVTRRRVELEERRAAARRAAAEREAAHARAAAGRERLAELDQRLLDAPRVRHVCASLAEHIAALREHAASLRADLDDGLDASQTDLDRAALVRWRSERPTCASSSRPPESDAPASRSLSRDSKTAAAT